jgi:hypothetical protein
MGVLYSNNAVTALDGFHNGGSMFVVSRTDYLNLFPTLADGGAGNWFYVTVLGDVYKVIGTREGPANSQYFDLTTNALSGKTFPADTPVELRVCAEMLQDIEAASSGGGGVSFNTFDIDAATGILSFESYSETASASDFTINTDGTLEVTF